MLCQVLEAPRTRPAPNGSVPDVATSTLQAEASRDGEIRLTYGELTALIADAVKQPERLDEAANG